MFEKRVRFLLITITAAFALLGLKIFYYQLIKGADLARAASSQRMLSSDIDSPRGKILDRNGIPFTDRSVRSTVVIKPSYFKENTDELKSVCEILAIDFHQTQKRIQDLSSPIVVDAESDRAEKVKELELKGISTIYSFQRYGDGSLAKHVLGYLNRVDQVGQAGIERYYDEELKYAGENTVGIITDAKNNLLEGLGYRLVKYQGTESRFSVQLTLDYHIQKLVEEVMDRHQITGAVVVEDVTNGDIVAMASKPDFEQNAVENFLQSPNNELFNRATASYSLGSIFKIIDSALIFEKDIDVNGTYFCEGYIKVGSREFKCSSYADGGHGLVDLRSAFSNSCNSFFIDRGIKIGYKDLINKAEAFGIGALTGVGEQGIGESAGNLPDPTAWHSNGDIANISIGQGAITASTLQVADIVATVANGGIKNSVNIVDSVVDENGNRVRRVKTEKGDRIITKEIADRIKALMVEVTRTGTGTRANLEAYGGAAGKTGSAETGREGVVHAWFAGYFPQKNPKYSIAVFIENGQRGGGAAAPVFAEIAEEIMKKGF